MVFPGKVLAVPVSMLAVNGRVMGGAGSDRNHGRLAAPLMPGCRANPTGQDAAHAAPASLQQCTTIPNQTVPYQTIPYQTIRHQSSLATAGQSSWCSPAVASVSCQGSVSAGNVGNKVHAVVALVPACQCFQLFRGGVVCKFRPSGSAMDKPPAQLGGRPHAPQMG
jgi:hypothetical protein